jgi:hypothetical protein
MCSHKHDLYMLQDGTVHVVNEEHLMLSLFDCQDAFNDFFEPPSGVRNDASILVITDGVPDSEEEVEFEIIQATQRMQRDSELSISFIQIGGDEAAARWLSKLDDDLLSHGAKFDIVDKVTAKDLQDIGFSRMIELSLND